MNAWPASWRRYIIVSSLRLEVLGDLLLDLRELRIGEIERHADHRHALRATPFVAEINRRLELQPARVELRVQLRDLRLERAAFDAQTELADARVQQPLPLLVPAHGGTLRS